MTYLVSHRRKFTFAQAQQIRSEYAECQELRPLARRWGCDQTTVRGIVRSETYAAPGPLDVEREPEPIPAPSDPVALYRLERDRRIERLKQNPLLASAEKAFRERSERDKQAGKGGRPKNVKPVNSLAGKLSKPGKPRMELSRSTDLAECLGPFYGVGS